MAYNINPLYEASTTAGKLGLGKLKAIIKGRKTNKSEMLLPKSSSSSAAEAGDFYHIYPGASRKTIAGILRKRRHFNIDSSAGKYIKKITDKQMT